MSLRPKCCPTLIDNPHAQIPRAARKSGAREVIGWNVSFPGLETQWRSSYRIHGTGSLCR